MEYSVYITLDKTLTKDYCFLTSNEYDEESIKLNVYTNGKEKIDFRKLSYLSFSERYYNDFIAYFSFGRNIVDNAKIIYVTNTSKEQKNTKKENRELMRLIKNNDLQNKKLYIDVGAIKLTDEDMDLISPFKKCKLGLVTFDDTGIYHGIDELETIYEIANDVVKRTSKHDFSEIEKMLYAYDLIRTNYIVDPEYEKKMEKILKLYHEPSYCYSLIYKEVLNRLKIKNIYSFGNFFMADRRAYNVAYVKDEDYDIEGVYFFDIGDNSKQRIKNSLMSLPNEDVSKELINNYESFCKTKDFMTYEGCLDTDFTFGDFDQDFLQLYDYVLEKDGINGIFNLRTLINNVGYFIDGRTVIDGFKGIHSDEELEEIRNNVERYVDLFSRDINAEDFMEILFNVRKVEYMENKELFPLSMETFKECIAKSKFEFINGILDVDETEEYEKEDLNEMIQETFENCFEEAVDSINLEDRIRKLKLSLNKDNNKPKKDDNN